MHIATTAGHAGILILLIVRRPRLTCRTTGGSRLPFALARSAGCNPKFDRKSVVQQALILDLHRQRLHVAHTRLGDFEENDLFAGTEGRAAREVSKLHVAAEVKAMARQGFL